MAPRTRDDNGAVSPPRVQITVERDLTPLEARALLSDLSRLLRVLFGK